MAIQSTGSISFSDIQTEMGGTGSISASDYYRGGLYTTNYGTCPVPVSGAIGLGNFYGAKKNPCGGSYNTDYQASTCQRTVVSSYQWSAQGYASGGTRKTGNRDTLWETTIGTSWDGYVTQECNATNLGNTVGDGTNRGGTYSDIGHAWPRYRFTGTGSVVAEVGRPNPNSGQSARSGGTVYWYQCTANTSEEVLNFSEV